MLYFLLVLFLVITADSLNEDHYWREYTGVIPSDALVGGKDVSGKNVYIGQAYVKDVGIFVAQINPGVVEVSAIIYGLPTINRYIKILCGYQNNFEWIPVTDLTFHTLVLGKHPVIGGHEDAYGMVNIGRTKQDGSVKIGKINPFYVDTAHFYWANNGKEDLDTHSYEVLVCKHRINTETDAVIANVFKKSF